MHMTLGYVQYRSSTSKPLADRVDATYKLVSNQWPKFCCRSSTSTECVFVTFVALSAVGEGSLNMPSCITTGLVNMEEWSSFVLIFWFSSSLSSTITISPALASRRNAYPVSIDSSSNPCRIQLSRVDPECGRDI